MFMKNAWYIAAWAHEIKDAPLGRRICNEPVALFRDLSGKLGAVEDRCCHRGAPLQFGRIVEQGLQCGYHGLVFDTAGRCVDIPGQGNIPAKANIRSFPVVEKDEFVWIWMGDPELADVSKIIDYPFHNDYAKWPHKHGYYHVKANYMLMVDNLMDMTHLAYVHVGSIGGDTTSTHAAKMETKRTDLGLKYTRWMLGCMPPPTYVKAVPGLGGCVDRWQEFEYIVPGNILQWSGAKPTGTGAYEHDEREGGFSLRLFHGLTPETDGTCHYFWSTANGYRQDEPEATEQLFGEISRAFLEDKVIVEAQQARLEELGDRPLVDIVSDAARIHMRRTVDRLIKEETL